MRINYEWVCKFCGKPNAAGTDRCAFCRNPAIARPIDIDPQYEKERLAEEKRRKRLEHLPPGLRAFVGFLWGACVIGAFVARFSWTIGAMMLGIGLMIFGGVPAFLIEHSGEPEPKSQSRGSSQD